MIARYTRPDMGGLWSLRHVLETWLKVELLACEAMVKTGQVPKASYEKIKKTARVDEGRMAELEESLRHDVIAFVTSIAEKIGPEGRYLHLGLTSSDVLDTSFSLLLKESGAIILEDLAALLATLKTLAQKHKHTLMIGRTHGMHAEPTTFGLKCALWHDDVRRHAERMRGALEEACVGKLSGAVGTYATVSPEVEAHVCETLGLKPAAAATQVVPRDRYAVFFTNLALIGCTVEKIAVEIRHLQRAEVSEVEESFGTGQKGSSAMPHKRNPIGSENLTGLARMLRGYALVALENVALWHERDISHSSAERIIGPDACILADYMLARLNGILKGLLVRPERMAENLERSGGVFASQRVLLRLIASGLSREEAYALVQRLSFAALDQKRPFAELLRTDTELAKRVPEKDLKKLLDPASYTKEAELVFKRVFGGRAK